MPRDLDAVLDGMGWQLDEAERADMHRLQVATLLAWGVHPDSIGPTRTGGARLAQTMAEALRRAGQAGGLEPGPHWPRPAPPRDPALAGMPERFTAAGVRDRVEWRGGPCPVPLASFVTVWTRGNPGELGAPPIISRTWAGSLDWSHGDVPLASDIVAFFAETPEAVQRTPVFLARDIAALLRVAVPVLSDALVHLGFPPRSVNMTVEVDEALAAAEHLRTVLGGPSDCDTDPVQTRAAYIALTPAEIQSGMDRVRWAENLIRQLPEDHDGRNSWLLNYSKACLMPAAYDTLEQLEFFQRVEALADRATQRPPFANRWTFDGQALRAFAQALHSSESRQVGTVMLHISKADGDKLAEALRLAKPGPVVLESAPPIAPKFDEAVKVLQAWGYSFTGDKWAPPEGAPFYVKRTNVSRVRRGCPPATDVVLVASLDTVSIPGDWVAVYPGPADEVRQATVEEVFLAEVLDEVLRARAKFPGDRVMGLALAEEFGELIKAVLDETPERVRREAVQTAAMCVRLVLDGDGSVKEWRAARGLAPLVQTQKGTQP